jgi:hypothetical protein
MYGHDTRKETATQDVPISKLAARHGKLSVVDGLDPQFMIDLETPQNTGRMPYRSARYVPVWRGCRARYVPVWRGRAWRTFYFKKA